MIGSGLLEDRCGVCDGDGSSCAPRGAQELCSCDAAVSAPRCNSSTPDSDVDHRPRPAAVGDGQMHEVEGPSATAGQIAIWLSLAGLGLLVVVVIIRPVKFADGSKHTESVRCAKSVVFLNFLIRFFKYKNDHLPRQEKHDENRNSSTAFCTACARRSVHTRAPISWHGRTFRSRGRNTAA